MKIINISQARENLPKLINDVFLESKSYLITKRGIPMVKIIKVDKLRPQRKIKSRKNKEKVIKLIRKIKGVWNENKWKNKSSVEIVNFLRERSQRRYVR